jgi:SAM-dependent methyltransferase
MLVEEAQSNARYEFKGGTHSSHSALLRRFADRGEGRRVLDVGCAGGFLGEILAERGYRVTGVDFPGTVTSPAIEFHGADLEQGLDGIGGGFDYVVTADVLEHLRDPLRLLAACRERLREGGAIVASLPNSGHWYFRANVLMGRFPKHDKGLFDRTHVQFCMWDDWVELFHRAGLRIERMEPTATPFGLEFPRLPQAVVAALEWGSYAASVAWKRLFAYQFVVVAR